jgi:hypothetical protein
VAVGDADRLEGLGLRHVRRDVALAVAGRQRLRQAEGGREAHVRGADPRPVVADCHRGLQDALALRPSGREGGHATAEMV